MIVGKLVLRSSAGRHGPKGNFTVLYDGEGELKFGLVRYHIYHNGKGKGLLSQSYKYNLVYHLIVQFYSKWLLVKNSTDVNSEILARILFSRIAFKDIFTKIKNRDYGIICLHQ